MNGQGGGGGKAQEQCIIKAQKSRILYKPVA